jgi:DNA-binding XRE family transcriptional regulator
MTRKERINRGVGWRCAVLRQCARLDQRQAAKFVGISLVTWRKIEAGRGCRTETLIKIVIAFGCSWEWILGVREAA